jgi:nitrile hydratase accessory protein
MANAVRTQLDVEGAGAPPRRNGELVFQEPWEGRAFGLAVALGENGLYPWEEFRSRLIAAIAEADRLAGPACSPGAQEKSEYYVRWLAALRRLLVERGILHPDEIERRMQEFAAGERDIVNPGA